MQGEEEGEQKASYRMGPYEIRPFWSWTKRTTYKSSFVLHHSEKRQHDDFNRKTPCMVINKEPKIYELYLENRKKTTNYDIQLLESKNNKNEQLSLWNNIKEQTHNYVEQNEAI